jgi:predicted metal-dependent HD superfamily phosphohydrolase
MHRANSIRWAKLWTALAASGDSAPAYQRLVRAYAEPHRTYHTLRHIGACLEELDAVRLLAERPAAVEAAIWYHDAVYDPSAAANESESAAFAMADLAAAGVTPDTITQIESLILATHTHAPEPHTDAALVVDIDLAIFGQAPGNFDAYERAIRDEFFWVEPEVYREKRSEILGHFLARPFVYSSDFFRLRYEQAARDNLSRSLRKLADLPS